jgi:hypothetical protein
MKWQLEKERLWSISMSGDDHQQINAYSVRPPTVIARKAFPFPCRPDSALGATRNFSQRFTPPRVDRRVNLSP